MRQKFRDILLIMQTDRKVWAFGGFIAVVLFLWLLTGNWSQDGGGLEEFRPAAVPGGASKQNNPKSNAYKDLQVAFQNNIENLTNAQNIQDEKFQRLENEIKQQTTKVKGLFEAVVDRVEMITKDVENLAEQLKAKSDAAPPTTPVADIPAPDELEPLGFEESSVPPPPTEPVKPTRVSVISPGDSVKVKLLTGVNAPVDGTPYPVVFKIVGPITGPDGSSLDVGEARLVAAAIGSESDSRAIFRLTNLSMRHPDGRRAVLPIDGWVIGEDGVRGFQGRLIDKLGRLIAATAGVSFVGSLGDSIANRNNRVIIAGAPGLTVYNDELKAAIGNSATDASKRLIDVLINRYERLIPIVEILSGREGAAIFSVQSEVAPIIEDNVSEGIYPTGLD